MINDTYQDKVNFYNAQAKAYNEGLNEIKQKVVEATELNQKGELSNSQLKKIKANAYNEERDYRAKTPRPKRPDSPDRAGKRALIASILTQLDNSF